MAGTMRSPNYPAATLSQALEALEKLWSEAKRATVDYEGAVKAMGYQSLSGPARAMIGALRQYGLIDKPEKGHLQISELGVTVLHGQGTEQHRAIRQAATTPPLFNELAQTHAESSPQIIWSYLITKKRFTDDAARKAAKAFKEAIWLAGGAGTGYTHSEAQEKPEAMPAIDTIQPSRPTDGSGILSLKVPYGSGALNVEIRVTGEPLKRAHIERVRKYLELAEGDLTDGEDASA